jgi:hypothetical protein
MTITTLAGVRHFDAEQCLVVNFVRDVEAIPSLFARSPSFALHEVPFTIVRPLVGLTFGAIRVLRKVPCQGQPDCAFSLAHLIVWKNGDIWRYVVRMITRGKACSGGLLGRKIEGIRSETTVPARPMYVLKVT